MPVSKRTRFEVLRRDNYTCRYCRSTDGELTVDHVTPVTLGGTDDPSNLVACCKDCNAGKSSTSLDAETVAQVSEDALRWQAAMRQAMDEMNSERDESVERFSWFLEEWDHLLPDRRHCLPHYWLEVLTEWESIGVRRDDVIDALKIAERNDVYPINAFNYARGVIRNRIAEATERARKIMEAAEDGT